jgi:hypothetical protein
VRPNGDLVILVQQHRKQCLRAASILYCLRRKEDILCCVMVEAAIWWLIARLVPRQPFEEEYYAIDGTASSLLAPIIFSAP